MAVVAIAIIAACDDLPVAPEKLGTTSQALALGVWTQLPKTNTPALALMSMVHDTARGVTVVFGGTETLTPHNDEPPTVPSDETYEWNGSVWTKAAPLVRPPARLQMSSTFDGRQVVVYGGRKGQQVLDDMWGYDGKTWTKLCGPCDPGKREGAAMTYDAERDEIVLTGGTDGHWHNPGDLAANPAISTTWAWKRDVGWLEKCVGCTVKPAGVGGHMVYDAKRKVSVLVGGRPFADWCVGFQPSGSTCDPPGMAGRKNTWEWDGATWKIACDAAEKACGLGQRHDHALVYDSIRGRVVMYGGVSELRVLGFDNGATVLRAELLEWDGSAWRSLCPVNNPDCGPASRAGAGAAFERSRRQMIVVGGTRLGDALAETWVMRVRGEACTTGATCNSGSCVDGVCCDAVACGACETCNQQGSAGVCIPIRGRDDPDTCTGARTCSSAPRLGADGKLRVCVAQLGESCKEPADCLSGHCSDGVCCDTRCDQSCDACAARRGAPRDGTCGPARAGDNGEPACIARRCTGASALCEPDATCSSEKDCQDGYYCRPDVHQCEPLVDCDCAPYRCNLDGTCKARCESVLDCRAPSVCDRDHQCVTLSPASSSGCTAGTARGDVAGAWPLALATALFIRRRRRR